MNVAVVGPSYPHRGGIAHYTSLLAAQFAREHSVRFYSFEQLYPDWLFPGKSQYDPSADPLVSIEPSRWLVPWLPGTWLRVKRDWEEHRPRVVVLQWWVPIMAPMTAWLIRAARQLDAATTVICHNVLPHERRPADAWLARLALRHADLLIVHNSTDRACAEKLLPGSNSACVSHPTYHIFASSEWTRDKARAALELQGRVLLFFGIARPYKGLSDLISAMPAVLAEMDVTLLIVGEIWGDQKAYEQQIKKAGLESCVRIVNRYVANEEVPKYFAVADLVVLPYRDATGSGVLQLAHGLGVPVVGTRTGSLPEVIRDGENGFLVEPGNTAELSRAIIRFFREDCATAFRTAVKRDNLRFEWDTLIDTILQTVTERRVHASA